MSKTINVDSLTRTSVQYDPILRMLPYNDLRPRLAEMGFRFISSDKELREVSFERKGGIARPLAAGVEDPDTIAEIGKAKESKLVPEWGYTALVEDIMNYENVNVIGNNPEHVDPVTKKHPQEMLILESVVKTVNEDLLDAIYFSKRDDEDPSPYGLFDGIFEKLDVLVAASEITEAKGNLVATGAFVAPTTADDYAAYSKMVTALRSANWGLKRGGALLKITPSLYYKIKDALANKLKAVASTITVDVLTAALSADAQFPGLVISIEAEMGTGDRFIVTKNQNFDMSLWTDSATSFVQVRNPFKNPNLVQYWSQWKAADRIRQHHAKMLLTNDRTNTANQLSGDYIS